MDRDSIEQTIKEIIAEQFGTDKNEIKLESSFEEDFHADSLDAVEIVMEIEEKYDLSIKDEDANKIKTIKDAVDYIEAHYKS